MMNRRTMIALAVIFVLLLGITLAQNYAANQQPQDQQLLLLRVFPEMAVLDIHAIRLQTPDEQLLFTISRASDGAWMAPNNPVGTLNAEAATNIAQTVVLLPYRNTVLPENGDIAQYGFQPYGFMLIQIVMADESQHIVVLGGLTPTGNHYYALVDERPELFLIERGPIDYLANFLLTPPVYLTTPTPQDNLNSDGG